MWYNGRPEGADKKNRKNPNSKVFISFYYHGVAKGRKRVSKGDTKIDEKKRNK